ncbi:PolC-type DNA polymerase III [Neisseria sp.]|uniref:3'-5' exonuclease n=1 Tax=Neisseria sp. TaxID=192066 RepID=UPI0035A085E5
MADFPRWPHLAAAFAGFGMPVAVVDLETTGGSLTDDRVTEIAVLRFSDGLVSRYERLVNPQQEIPEFVARLTGISNETVADAPVFGELADELLPLLRGTLVVAHNSRFDYTFLRREFARSGLDFAAPALCTVQLSRKLYPEHYKHSLDSIICRFGIPVENRHRAMTDVLVLADFLELSLTQKNETEWANHCRHLMNPKPLPAWLPDALSQQLYALPDSDGVTIWFDAFGQAQAVEAHERAFAETAALLHGKHLPAWVQSASEVRFLPSAGSLHTVSLKAQTMLRHNLRPSENGGSGAKNYFTVRFAPDTRGRLQARIVPLADGCRSEPPYGLFLHKKAACRALAEWAQAYGFCPESLGILPDGHDQTVCPVHAVGQCSGTCNTSDGIETQNRRIREAAPLLPVVDWGRAHDIEITETQPFSATAHTFRCTGGALLLPDGQYYFDRNLPALLKHKFKNPEHAVLRILA